MSTAYLNLYSHAEVMSMYGVDLDQDIDTDLDLGDDDTRVEQERCCGNCMDCLGLSWRDFM
jgi:hypothetical protein